MRLLRQGHRTEERIIHGDFLSKKEAKTGRLFTAVDIGDSVPLQTLKGAVENVSQNYPT